MNEESETKILLRGLKKGTRAIFAFQKPQKKCWSAALLFKFLRKADFVWIEFGVEPI